MSLLSLTEQKLVGDRTAFYKYPWRKGNTREWKELFKLEDSFGTRTKGYKLATNRSKTEIGILTTRAMRIWDQQDCKQWNEAKHLISQPAWLGIPLLSLIHPNNLSSRKSGGGRWSSPSKSLGEKTQQSSTNINETNLWQMACTDNSSVTKQNWRRLWPSALHAHGSMKRHEMQASPQWHCCTKNPSLSHMRQSGTSYSHSKQNRNTSEKSAREVKAGNSHSLYSQCKVFETENSCDTPTIRLADMAMVCQVAHRLAEHGHNAAMSPCVGQSLRTDLPHLCFNKRGTPKCLWHLGRWLTTRQNNKLGPGKQLLSVNTKQQQTKNQNCWKQNVE